MWHLLNLCINVLSSQIAISSARSSSLPYLGKSPSISKSVARPSSSRITFTFAYLIALKESTTCENPAIPVANVRLTSVSIRAPAIFIDTVARLGHKGGIIGGVGKDDFGKCLLDRLKSDGVDVSHVIENPKKATGCAIVTYFDDGSRKFIFHMGNTPAVEAKAPQKDVLDGVRYFHVMGCSLFADIEFAKEILKAAQTAKKIGAKVSFDPNIRKELIGEKETCFYRSYFYGDNADCSREEKQRRIL